MKLTIMAAECCKGSKAEIVKHLTADWMTTYVDVTDPEWTNEPCIMSLPDLKTMGFESLTVQYKTPSGKKSAFVHAL